MFRARNHEIEYDEEDENSQDMEYDDEEDQGSDYDAEIQEGYTSDPETAAAHRNVRFEGEDGLLSRPKRGKSAKGPRNRADKDMEGNLKNYKLTNKDYVQQSKSAKKGKYGVTVP